MMMQHLKTFCRPAMALALFQLVGITPAAGAPDQHEVSAGPATRQFTPLDLTDFYDLHAADRSQFGTWEVVPKGRQVFDGVPFDVGGMIRLFGRVPPPHRTIYRNEVNGIPVGHRFDRLHLLHGTGWTTEDGEIVARVVFNYDDGDQASLRLIYGRHVRDWWHRDLLSPGGISDPDSGIAWIGHHGVGLRLFRTSLTNPHPQKEVVSLDIISARSAVTPAILSATTGPKITPLQNVRGMDIGEGEDTILFQALDLATDEGIPEAGLHVTYGTGSTWGYWGSFATGPEGIAEITYPPGELKMLTVTVFARGREAESVSWHSDAGEEIPLWYTIRLDEVSAQ